MQFYVSVGLTNVYYQISLLVLTGLHGSPDGKNCLAPKLLDWLLIRRNFYLHVYVSLMMMNNVFILRISNNFSVPI
jgi:hypothetical protein